jgi:hypothetical protein
MHYMPPTATGKSPGPPIQMENKRSYNTGKQDVEFAKTNLDSSMVDFPETLMSYVVIVRQTREISDIDPAVHRHYSSSRTANPYPIYAEPLLLHQWTKARLRNKGLTCPPTQREEWFQLSDNSRSAAVHSAALFITLASNKLNGLRTRQEALAHEI